jgi:hypothetical protein
MATGQSAIAQQPAPAAPPKDAGRSRWFWPNLIILAALAPFATHWFKQHLELHFTEVLLIGGGITAWAALRVALALAEKLGKLDPLSLSQRALSSPETTLLLAVALVVMVALWKTTNSLYVQYDGGGAGDRQFVVRVSRASDRTPFMPDLVVGPATKFAGQAFLFRGEKVDLECKIVAPLSYEALPCSIDIGEAKRISVPGGFKSKTFHLLRIVPQPVLYAELPEKADQPNVRYRLDVTVDGKSYAIDDIRRQTIYAGGKGQDMPLVLSMQERPDYELYLGAALRAMGVEKDSSMRMAAVLSIRTITWDQLDARPGQRLRLSLKRLERRDGKEAVSEMDGFPTEYVVNRDKVQTVWIPQSP